MRAPLGFCEDPQRKKVVKSLTIDEGYFSVEKVWGLQSEGIRMAMGGGL